VFVSVAILIWQLVVLFACCLSLGLVFQRVLPASFSVLNKAVFCGVGGLFLLVLIAQNLIYLGVPVRISAWVLMAIGLLELWLCRSKLRVWIQRLHADRDIRTVLWIIAMTSTFHCVVPLQQGLEWYYGKGYPDYFSYVQLAEFLKEEPYQTDLGQIGLRPWMVNSAIWLKKQRIGQSIVTAEIAVWSGTDAKRAYPATIIFFLTALGVCLYTFLRGTGGDWFMSGCGAVLGGILPVITRLSLDAFLSQISVLLIFPFMACLLKAVDAGPRCFTVLFRFSFACLISASS
jgi:hypothetical protein